MALDMLRITEVLPASADRVYEAWLSGELHAKMTGAKATVEARVGGEHSAWDGYIEGVTLELEPSRRIVQSWRTSDFPLGHADSRLEVHLLDVPGGCEVTIVHSGIPEGQGQQYDEGWHSHYLEPMRRFFARSPKKAVPRPKKKSRAPAKKARKAAPRKKSGAKKKAKRRGRR